MSPADVCTGSICYRRLITTMVMSAKTEFWISVIGLSGRENGESFQGGNVLEIHIVRLYRKLLPLSCAILVSLFKLMFFSIFSNTIFGLPSPARVLL